MMLARVWRFEERRKTKNPIIEEFIWARAQEGAASCGQILNVNNFPRPSKPHGPRTQGQHILHLLFYFAPGLWEHGGYGPAWPAGRLITRQRAHRRHLIHLDIRKGHLSLFSGTDELE